MVALSSELAGAGSHLALDVGGVPLLVVRGGDGRARAFVNGCRHRGSPLVTGHGCAEGGLLRCPFHAWTYTTEGVLHATPNAEPSWSRPDGDPIRLHSRPCHEAHGLIFVRAEGDAPLPTRALPAPIASDMHALGLQHYRHFETRSATWHSNWKLLLETFLESYHVFSLHHESVHPWYRSHPMLHDAYAAGLRFAVARRSIEGLRDLPEERWQLADHATIQWWLAPNTLLTHTRDAALLWRFTSPEPSRCEVRTSFFYRERDEAPPDEARLREAFDLQLRVTGAEDFPAQERIQDVLDSGALPEVRFSANEAAAIHLHQTLDRLIHDQA